MSNIPFGKPMIGNDEKQAVAEQVCKIRYDDWDRFARRKREGKPPIDVQGSQSHKEGLDLSFDRDEPVEEAKQHGSDHHDEQCRDRRHEPAAGVAAGVGVVVGVAGAWVQPATSSIRTSARIAPAAIFIGFMGTVLSCNNKKVPF